jgi:hypothetical protein
MLLETPATRDCPDRPTSFRSNAPPSIRFRRIVWSLRAGKGFPLSPGPRPADLQRAPAALGRRAQFAGVTVVSKLITRCRGGSPSQRREPDPAP